MKRVESAAIRSNGTLTLFQTIRVLELHDQTNKALPVGLPVGLTP